MLMFIEVSHAYYVENIDLEQFKAPKKRISSYTVTYKYWRD